MESPFTGFTMLVEMEDACKSTGLPTGLVKVEKRSQEGWLQTRSHNPLFGLTSLSILANRGDLHTTCQRGYASANRLTIKPLANTQHVKLGEMRCSNGQKHLSSWDALSAEADTHYHNTISKVALAVGN